MVSGFILAHTNSCLMVNNKLLDVAGVNPPGSDQFVSERERLGYLVRINPGPLGFLAETFYPFDQDLSG